MLRPILHISLIFLFNSIATATSASEPLTAQQVARYIWERPDGNFVTRQLTMQLTDPNGNIKTRQAEVMRGIWNGVKKTRIQFLAPRRVKHTAFLTYDYEDAATTDEQWMYLPALRRERRIPASDRGDNFMGSEFTYEDIKSELKFPLQDYDFELLAITKTIVQIKGTPKTQALSQELGYGAFQADIDKNTWLPRSLTFWDPNMQQLKQITVLAVMLIDSFQVASDIQVENLQTGHVSRFTYSDVAYHEQLQETLFNVSAIRK